MSFLSNFFGSNGPARERLGRALRLRKDAEALSDRSHEMSKRQQEVAEGFREQKRQNHFADLLLDIPIRLPKDST